MMFNMLTIFYDYDEAIPKDFTILIMNFVCIMNKSPLSLLYHLSLATNYKKSVYAWLIRILLLSRFVEMCPNSLSN